MRKTLYMLFAVLGICLLSGCSDDNDNNSPLAKQLAGEWHLASWNGRAPEGFDAYVSFTEGGSFEIYQQVDQSVYEKFTGSYKLDDKILSGSYSDRTPWLSSYEISFDEAGNTLTMTSSAAMGEVSVYKRTPIPGSAKDGARIVKSTRSASRLLF